MSVYWPQEGKANTAATVELALKRAAELGLKHIVVASASGHTAGQLAGQGPAVVCVRYQYGFGGDGNQEMAPEVYKRLRAAGVRVHTATHLFAGVDRALRLKFSGVYPAEIIAATLRAFGQGTKVAVEVAVMALDAGLIPFGADVVAVAGSDEGADTALVLRPAHAHNFFDLKVREIICKPCQF